LTANLIHYCSNGSDDLNSFYLPHDGVIANDALVLKWVARAAKEMDWWQQLRD